MEPQILADSNQISNTKSVFIGVHLWFVFSGAYP